MTNNSKDTRISDFIFQVHLTFYRTKRIFPSMGHSRSERDSRLVATSRISLQELGLNGSVR